MSELTAAAAAAELGVTSRQVARLARSGELTVAREVGGMLMLDAGSVRRLSQTSRKRGRPWGPEVAWAAASVLSDGPGNWVSAPQLTRLGHRLRRSSADEVAYLARRRATVRRMRAWDGDLSEISSLLVATGTHAIESGVTGTGRFRLTATASTLVDGYTLIDDVHDLVEHFGMVPDASSYNVIVRTVTQTDAFRTGLVPIAAIAMDLMDSLDTRERSAGRRVLDELLDDFR